MTPWCCACGRVLDRIDHYRIEHLILRGDEYQPANAAEGLANEIDVRCGYCHESLTREQHVYFYRRWYVIPPELRATFSNRTTTM